MLDNMYTALQSQKAVAAYLKSKLFLPVVFAQHFTLSVYLIFVKRFETKIET